MSEEKKSKCPKCNDTGIIRVLGGGGDYEDWPCPECKPLDHANTIANTYGYDEEGNE